MLEANLFLAMAIGVLALCCVQLVEVGVLFSVFGILYQENSDCTTGRMLNAAATIRRARGRMAAASIRRAGPILVVTWRGGGFDQPGA